eukprot:scaffold4760_cov113-Isochrysis_galbana.AAC.2
MGACAAPAPGAAELVGITQRDCLRPAASAARPAASWVPRPAPAACQRRRGSWTGPSGRPGRASTAPASACTTRPGRLSHRAPRGRPRRTWRTHTGVAAARPGRRWGRGSPRGPGRREAARSRRPRRAGHSSATRTAAPLRSPPRSAQATWSQAWRTGQTAEWPLCPCRGRGRWRARARRRPGQRGSRRWR